MSNFETLATFTTHRDQHVLFKSSDLVAEWARSYPMIFGADDVRLASSQGGLGYHFYEWLAAVLVYHTLGHLSLVEQYQYESHKRALLAEIMSPDVMSYISNHPEFGSMACPDLFVYLPNLSDWYFCEVKGPGDRLRPKQEAFFRELSARTEKPVRMIEFRFTERTRAPVRNP